MLNNLGDKEQLQEVTFKKLSDFQKLLVSERIIKIQNRVIAKLNTTLNSKAGQIDDPKVINIRKENKHLLENNKKLKTQNAEFLVEIKLLKGKIEV